MKVHVSLNICWKHRDCVTLSLMQTTLELAKNSMFKIFMAH